MTNNEFWNSNSELYNNLMLEGYSKLIVIRGKICGLQRFVFTAGLCYGITEDFYEGRYCFHSMFDAEMSLQKWDGIGDPPGDWIKHKGKTEYPNPNKN